MRSKLMSSWSLEAKYGTPGPGVIKQVLERKKIKPAFPPPTTREISQSPTPRLEVRTPIAQSYLEKKTKTSETKMCTQRLLSKTFPIWVSHLLPPTPKSLWPSSRLESLKPQLGIVKATLTWHPWEDGTHWDHDQNTRFASITCQQHMSELWKWIPKKSA